MRENIFLIGFMGAGKSSIARTLKNRYGMNLIEMDEQIEHQEQMSISEIFARKGEEYFRQLETGLLEGLQGEKNTVVSCGGGVAMRQCNVDAMRKSGTIIYLSAMPETIYSRVRNSHSRPLLEGNMNVAYIAGLLEKRMPRYLEAADRIVATDGRTLEQICAEILQPGGSENRSENGSQVRAECGNAKRGVHRRQ
jgi:shikimate kinase